jgi:hypothetical protein
MRVIARIPDVSVRVEPAAERRDVAPPRIWRPRRRTGILVGLSDAWPTWPIAALAVFAVATWLLASWKDQARLERQRSELRLASEPAGTHAAPATPARPPATGGAVLR